MDLGAWRRRPFRFERGDDGEWVERGGLVVFYKEDAELLLIRGGVGCGKG